MDENGAVLSQEAIDALLNSQMSDDSGDEAPAEESAPAVEAAVETAPEPVAEAAPEPAAVEPAPAPEPAAPPATAAAPPPAPAAVTINAPPPPGVTPPPGVVHAAPPAPAAAEPAAPAPAPEPVGGVSEEQAMMIAGEAAEAAIAPVQADVGLISGRVDALEAALAKIQQLEAQVAALKAQRPAPSSGGLDLEALKPLVDRILALEKGAKNSPLFNLYEKFTCSSCGNHGAAQARARCGSCGKEGWFGRKEAA